MRHLIRSDEELFNPTLVLGLYNEAIEAEKELVELRAEAEHKKEALNKSAEELGVKIIEVDCADGNPIPAESQMAKTIETLRLSYLASLFSHNSPNLIESANDTHHMVHTVNSEIKYHSTGYSSWNYSLQHDYIKISCDEEIPEMTKNTDYFSVQSDMEVLEWKRSGYDRDGDWKEDGFPSKWINHYYVLPKSISIITDILWKDAEVPCEPYKDFRWIFFASFCGGTWNGREGYTHGLDPYPWNTFEVNSNDMQFSFPIKSIGWNSQEHVTEIQLYLQNDGKTEIIKE